MSRRTSIFEDLGSIGERLREIQREEQRQLPADPAKPELKKIPIPSEEEWYDGGYYCHDNTLYHRRFPERYQPYVKP